MPVSQTTVEDSVTGWLQSWLTDVRQEQARPAISTACALGALNALLAMSSSLIHTLFNNVEITIPHISSLYISNRLKYLYDLIHCNYTKS